MVWVYKGYKIGVVIYGLFFVSLVKMFIFLVLKERWVGVDFIFFVGLGVILELVKVGEFWVFKKV